MARVHAAFQVGAVLFGLAAAYIGWVSYLERRRGASPVSEGFPHRRHVCVGTVFAGLLALGYGLGVWTVHRGGRDVLTSVHALVGTVIIMVVAVVSFVGMALVSREDDRLARMHRLFGCAAFALIAVQVVLGIRLLSL